MPKPDYMEYDPSVYKKSVLMGEKGTVIGNAVGEGLKGIGNVLTGIFGGSGGTTATGGSYVSTYANGVPVNVGVDSSTKKWLTYGGIAAGAVLLVAVLVMAFKKR